MGDFAVVMETEGIRDEFDNYSDACSAYDLLVGASFDPDNVFIEVPEDFEVKE